MSFSSFVIDDTRVLDVGGMPYILYIHFCVHGEHHDLMEQRDAGETRINRLLDIVGVSGAKLMGTTLILSTCMLYNADIEAQVLDALKQR